MTRSILRIAAAAAVVAAPLAVYTASHREAPITALDRPADITDWYSFVSYDDPSKLTMVLSVDPLLEPGNGPNYFPFDPELLYEMKVDNNHDAVPDVTLQFRFQVLGLLVGAVMTVVFAKLFMSAYPVLALDQTVMTKAQQPAQWQSAMTYKFVGALRGLIEDKPYQRHAIALGMAIGLAAMKRAGRVDTVFGDADWGGQDLFGIDNALVGQWPVVRIEGGKARIVAFGSIPDWLARHGGLLRHEMLALGQMWHQRQTRAGTPLPMTVPPELQDAPGLKLYILISLPFTLFKRFPVKVTLRTFLTSKTVAVLITSLNVLFTITISPDVRFG